MNKKIITIAEIVFALIFVVLLSVFMATINSKGNSANNQLVSTLEANDSSSVQAYSDGTMFKGTRVLAALDQIRSLNGDVKMKVHVFTAGDWNKSSGGLTGGTIYDENKPYTVKDTTSDNYINPQGDFYCYHAVNSNGIIVGLAFVQKDCEGFNPEEGNTDGKWTNGIIKEASGKLN